MTYKKFSFLFLFFSPLIFATPTRAHISSISAATASNGAAALENIEGPFSNAALLAYQRGYFFGSGFSQYQSAGGSQKSEMALYLTDNMKETVLPTSLSYVDRRESLTQTSARDIKISFGNFFSGRSAGGLSVNYRNLKIGETTGQQFNLSPGLIWAARKDISVGVVFDNIIAQESTLPVDEQLLPQIRIAGAFNFNKYLRLRTDLQSQNFNNWSRPIIGGGLETFYNRWLIFRLGLKRDFLTRENVAATGAGFSGPKFEIHYAFQDIKAEFSREFRHSIDLGVPLW